MVNSVESLSLTSLFDWRLLGYMFWSTNIAGTILLHGVATATVHIPLFCSTSSKFLFNCSFSCLSFLHLEHTKSSSSSDSLIAWFSGCCLGLFIPVVGLVVFTCCPNIEVNWCLPIGWFWTDLSADGKVDRGCCERGCCCLTGRQVSASFLASCCWIIRCNSASGLLSRDLGLW